MSFRLIDIDELEGSRWVDDIPEVDQNQLSSETAQRTSEVRGLLSRGKHVDALIRALESPPYGCTDENLKISSCQTVLEVLGSFKSQDVPDAIQSISPESQDILMKYVFRSMAHPSQFNCAVALAWHEKLVEANGPSAIIRVMSDRRTV
ncbi:arp2/3 complex subunit [Entomophthora muscae]|uniref:Arp2/3 complex subunit n=1 Tax=Entomophthora muscae TaxID=34485 RepID=A0ACC2T2U9_9FUNG|nr:arp2/3 complex subunit [Entomophthora muscae]